MFSLICPKTVTTFQYETYHHVSQIGCEWDSFLPTNHHLRSSELQVLESIQPDDMTFRYVIVRQNDNLIGLLYLQQIRFSAKHYDTSAFSGNSFLQLISPCVLNQSADLLICGNLFRMHFPCFYLRQDLPVETLGQILNDYLESNQTARKFAGVFLKDVPQALNLKEVQGINFKHFPDDLTMEMPLSSDWANLGDYAQNLSKKYRQRFKKTQTAAENIIRKEFDLTEIIANADKIYQLYQQVVERQSIRIGLINSAYFVEMKRALCDNFRIVAYFKENEIVAFASHIFYENQTCEIHYIGLDYAQNEQHQLYLNILFDGLEMGISHRQKSIELGRTARLAKASLGAKPIYLNSYYAMRRGLPAFVFGILQYFFTNKMGEDWQNRNPMK